MKKLFIGLLTVLVVMAAFVACNNNAVEEELIANGFAQVTFDKAVSKALSAEVESTDVDNLYWRYTAEKLDQGGTSGQTGPELANSVAVVADSNHTWKPGLSSDTLSEYLHVFATGDWKFTLYAFKTAVASPYSIDNCVLTGSANATVVVSQTKTVTVEVNRATTGTGTVSFTDISFAAYPNAVKKYKIGDGDWTSFTDQSTSISQVIENVSAAASKTISVGVFNNDSDADPITSASITKGVYRGLATIITGSIEELTGGVIFEAEVEEGNFDTKSATTAGATTSDSPEVTVTTAVSPDKKSGDTEETTAKFPAGALSTSAATNDTFTANLTVTSYSASACSSFEVVGSGDVAIAGIDCKLTVAKNSEAAKPVTSFNGKDVTITTYIVKGLNSAKIYYAADNTAEQPKATSGTDANAVDIYADDVALGENLGYSQATGKLVFTTTHFSTFQVEISATCRIVETNTAYDTLQGAASQASAGQTIELLTNITNTGASYGGTEGFVNKSVVVDLDGKTLANTNTALNDGQPYYTKSGIIFCGAGVDNPTGTIKDGTVTSADSTGIYAADGYNLTIENCTATTNTTEDNPYTAAVRASENSIVTIESGTYTGYHAVNLESSGATITINGGTFNGYLYFENVNTVDAYLNINGGNFDNKGFKGENGTKVHISITGGTFNFDPSAYTVLDYAVSKSDNTYSVSKYDASTTLDHSVTGGTFTTISDTKIATGYKAEADGDYWKVVRASYTVTFNLKGLSDSSIPSQQVAPGGKVTVPSEPTPCTEEWVFGGWYKETECTSEWNFETDTVNSNITLYVKWVRIKMPLYYWGGVGAEPDCRKFDGYYGLGTNVTVKDNIAFSSIPNDKPFTKEGYTFAGWTTDSKGTGTVYHEGDNLDIPDAGSELILYVKWEQSSPVQIS